MQVLGIEKEHDAGLYDSDTGKSLTTQRVIDITDDCPSGERTVLLYTSARRGRIVQITFPYPNEVYMGAHTHFFVDELRRSVAPRDDTFGLLAKRIGLPRKHLIGMIEKHAPGPALVPSDPQ